ncbi:hypothetical protein [Streptomyces sp. NPDC004675]|uniref:hypothetical protein n=1 Tax=Streptomyces sp. NPDC004675 TaxID=3154286 RepID=UPI0033A22170
MGEGSSEAAGIFDCEASLGPLLAPAHELAEGSGVHDEPTLADLVAYGVDRNGGVRGLAKVEPDRDHARPDLVLEAAEVCGGHPDLT